MNVVARRGTKAAGARQAARLLLSALAVLALGASALSNQIVLTNPNLNAAIAPDSGAILIGFAPAFSTSDGDIIEYAAMVAPADLPDIDGVIMEVHQASCCRNLDGSCHNWHAPTLAADHRFECHGLDVTLSYKVSVVARSANVQNGGNVAQYEPLLVSATNVVAVSDTTTSMNESEYNKVVADVVDHINGELLDDASARTDGGFVGALNIAAAKAKQHLWVFLGVNTFLLVLLGVLIRRCVVRRQDDATALPHYQPILTDEDRL